MTDENGSECGKKITVSEFKRAVEDISKIVTELKNSRECINTLSELLNEQVVDGAYKREVDLIKSIKEERENTEKLSTSFTGLNTHFRSYADELNTFLVRYNEIIEGYKTKLEGSVSKIDEGIDKSYDVVSGCVTVVDTLKESFETVKNSNAKVLKRLEDSVKESVNIQNRFYSAMAQTEHNILETIGGLTGIIEASNKDTKTDIEASNAATKTEIEKYLGEVKERDRKWREYFTGIHSNFKAFVDIATAINKDLTDREKVYIANLIKSANTAERFREAAESVEKISKGLPERLDNIIKHIAGGLFETQKITLDSLEDRFESVLNKSSELHFMQKGQQDEFERMMDSYKKSIGKKKMGVGLTVAVLAASIAGYQYLNAEKAVYSNVNLQEIKCEKPVYIERAKKNTTYCNQNDSEGIVFIDDKDSNGKADYIVVRKNRDGAVMYYGMDAKSVDAENNPNQFVKANNILAEQRENFNNKLKPGESYSVKLKRFIDDKIKVYIK